MQPKVLLLDEPLVEPRRPPSASKCAPSCSAIQKETGVTMVFVTHDQSEALALADRIVLMREGKIEQLGIARAEIYTPNPVSGLRR